MGELQAILRTNASGSPGSPGPGISVQVAPFHDSNWGSGIDPNPEATHHAVDTQDTAVIETGPPRGRPGVLVHLPLDHCSNTGA